MVLSHGHLHSGFVDAWVVRFGTEQQKCTKSATEIGSKGLELKWKNYKFHTRMWTEDYNWYEQELRSLVTTKAVWHILLSWIQIDRQNVCDELQNRNRKTFFHTQCERTSWHLSNDFWLSTTADSKSLLSRNVNQNILRRDINVLSMQRVSYKRMKLMVNGHIVPSIFTAGVEWTFLKPSTDV